MDYEHKEPLNNIIRHGPKVVESIRKEHNLDNKEDRETAIAIIDEWIKKQEHFVKKDYSKSYIEKTIITSNGSLERAKKQIDKMCTIRTLMPKYFQETNLKETDIITLLDKTYIAILPKLTEEYYRVILVRVKPNNLVTASDFTKYFRFIVFAAEYLKAHDFCRGFMLIADLYDTSFTDIATKINFVELQQFIPVLTECYGCKVKGLYIVTASKLVENFMKLLKPLFSEKIGSRIHAVTSRNSLKNLINGDVFPEDYGGQEKPVEQLHDDLIECLSSVSMQELMKDMNKAVTDESKRKIYDFNEQYIGMPGTFRTLSLD